MKNKSVKLISLILAVVSLLSVFSICSFAAEQKSYGKKYGFVKTVKSDYKTNCTSYSFKNDSGNIYLFFDAASSLSDKIRKTIYYGFELYKDDGYKTSIVKLSGSFPSSDSKAKVPVNMASLKSGVYYGLVYTFIKNTENKITVDADSIGEFKITVNKVASLTPVLNGVTYSVKGNRISWSSVKYAEYYRVYRKLYSETSWKKLCDVKTTSYVDNTVTHGEKYIYTVKAFDGEYSSLYNKTGVSAIYLDAPNISKPVSGNDNSVIVGWDEVQGAQKYYVYKRTENEKSYTRVATLKAGKTSFTDENAKKDGETYYYKVRAVSGISAGVLSKAVKITPFLCVKPTMKYKDGKVTVSWKSSGDSYILYKKDGSSWNVVYEGEETSFIDENVEVDVKYTYSLVAVKNGIKSSFYSKGVSITTLGDTIITSVSNDVDNSVLIKWDKKSGATGYEIYRKTAGEEYEKIGVAGNTSYYYDKTDKKNNLKYSYTVKAFSSVADGTTGIERVNHLYMTAPVLESVKSNKDGSNTVKWRSVSGAISYNVYRKTPNGGYSVVGSTTTLNFTDSKAKKGEKYYYTVKAVNGGTESSYMSGLGINIK